MSAITVHNLEKRYESSTAPAVHDVSFTVADREFLVLLGPSGCGKSTVLRMIAGLEPITSGTVSIDGTIVNAVPAKARDIAMVFQSYALYPHMKVYDNLAFGLRRRSVAAAEIDRRVRHAAARLGLDDLLDRKPQALSGGQRQRVALGRAIVREPKVFLFDEPLSNLDAALRVSTRNDLIRQQKEIGTTSIYVTHDQVEAMTMGDRICIMNHGRVVQIGKPLEVYGRPADAFVARFLGSPPMNLLDARVLADRQGFAVEIGDCRLPLGSEWQEAAAAYQGQEVILGFRPEDAYEREPDGRPLPRLPVSVSGVEQLGAETIVSMRLHGIGNEILLRTGRATSLAAGQTAEIFVDAAALHLFDPQTKKSLRRTMR